MRTHADTSTQTGSALSERCSFVPPSLWFMGHCTTLGNNHVASAPPLIYSINLQKKKPSFGLHFLTLSIPVSLCFFFFFSFPSANISFVPTRAHGVQKESQRARADERVLGLQQRIRFGSVCLDFLSHLPSPCSLSVCDCLHFTCSLPL